MKFRAGVIVLLILLNLQLLALGLLVEQIGGVK